MNTESLKEKTARGIAWGAANNGTTQVLNLVFGIILARRLSESDYGILALITIFTLIAGCIQSAGFSQALANMKRPRQEDYNAVFWFNIIAAATMYALLFGCAPLLSLFFAEPLLTDVSRLVFVTIPLSALGIVPNAKLWIEMRNRELAIANVTALICSGSTGVWMAYHGFGYWSLAWQQIVFIGVATTMKYLFSRWHPSPRADLRPIRPMLPFSIRLLFTNILTIASQNVQVFIFGHLLPTATVGQYGQASKWNTMASSFISSTMAQVAQPVLTKADDSEGRQERVFRKMLRFTAFVAFPLMFGLALVAREFIVLTITGKWLPCVPLLQILCIGGACLPLHTLYQNFIISRGRSDIYLRCIALVIVMQIAVTLAFAPWGVKAMVGAFAVLNVLSTFIWHLALQRITRLPLTSALADTLPFAAVAAVVMAAAYAATQAISTLWLLLAVRIAIAGLLYAGILWVLRVKVLGECLQFVISKIHR